MIEERLQRHADAVQAALDGYLQTQDPDYDLVIEAMRYSVLNGGKRIRPALLLEFYALFGGRAEDAVPFACALEMIHTYSLIHDDLPCMDNDDMRRGKPACHIAFPENIALLAGDALLTMAFEIAAAPSGLPAANVLRALQLLGKHAGVQGMIGGQVIDLQNEGKAVSAGLVRKMYALKTGALLKLAAQIAAALAGVEGRRLEQAELYCENIGLAFQIVDDLLDIEGDAKLLGKPVGSDAREEKSTLVSLIGVTQAKETVQQLSAAAKAQARELGSSTLEEIVDFLLHRDH